ncbi:MAG: restriction modification system specificity domain protein [Daejeonella sp.]|nr:restriction modification system specificity domain protein [Daejeonella sp.]
MTDVVVSSGYIILKNTMEISKEYYKWLLHIYDIVHMKTLGSGVRQTLSFTHIADSELPFPPLQEQIAISNFLDKKTTLIDQAIGIKEKQIELLKERKQILIHNAVTKGLDKNVKLKDSGLEWIGEIPEGWEVTKAKFYSQIFVPERAKPDLNIERDGIPWVTTDHLRNEILSENDVTYYVSKSAQKTTGSRIIKRNNVIATCVGNFGIASKTNFDCIINQQIQGYINLKINAEYLIHIIGISENYFKNNATMTTIMYVSKSTFGDMPVPLPDKDEQQQIVDYISVTSRKIASAISLKKQEIEKLKEYKASLINSAVTGKIRVN